MIKHLAKAAKKRESSGFPRFRESKLTHFLKDQIGGNSMIMVIACISLEEKYGEDSLRTIQFARNVKDIKISELKRNESVLGGEAALKVMEGEI
jgi:hypothetical protein